MVCDEEERLRELKQKLLQLPPSLYPSHISIVVQSDVIYPLLDPTFQAVVDIANLGIRDRRRGYCEPSRELLLDLCPTDWVLNLDADEWLTPFAWEQLPHWITEEKVDGYMLTRCTTIDGVEIERQRFLRLFRQSKLKRPVDSRIHSCWEIAPGGRVIHIDPESITHYKTSSEQQSDNLRYKELQQE
mgnify:FL=1